jgi:hypothetical protein
MFITKLICFLANSLDENYMGYKNIDSFKYFKYIMFGVVLIICL